MYGGAGSHALEIGRSDGTASTPFIDFHAGATSVDYDVRIIATAGTGVSGAGTLAITAGQTNITGNANVAGIMTSGNGSGEAAMTVAGGSTGSQKINFTIGGSTNWVVGSVGGGTSPSFQVQRYNGGSYVDSPLTISNTTGNIQIGTSDTVGQIFILDTKTGTGDPTGANGAMYYNSADGAFRCYENGAWKDCITALPQSVYLTANTAALSATTATNVTGVGSGNVNMAFTLAASTKYHYKFVVKYSVNNTATGIGVGAAYSGTGTNSWCAETIASKNSATGGQWAGYCSTGAPLSGYTTYDAEATGFAYPAMLEGYISTTTSGTLQLQFNNQDTNWASTVLAGSFGILEVVQ